MHDFSKPQPHVASQEEVAKKRKLPIYILVIVGIFLIALLVYMVADHSAESNCTGNVVSYAVGTFGCLDHLFLDQNLLN